MTTTQAMTMTQALCEVCDYIWMVTLTHSSGKGDTGCLGQGTGITHPQSYQRRLGLRMTGGGEFVMYRNEFRADEPLGSSAEDRLVRIGVGAFKGADWVHAAEGSDITAVPGVRYSFFYSGEGSF
jgi:hypothetical protein